MLASANKLKSKLILSFGTRVPIDNKIEDYYEVKLFYISTIICFIIPIIFTFDSITVFSPII